MEEESEEESDTGDEGGVGVGIFGAGAGGGTTTRGDGVWVLFIVGLFLTGVRDEDRLAVGTCRPGSDVTFGVFLGSSLAGHGYMRPRKSVCDGAGYKLKRGSDLCREK